MGYWGVFLLAAGIIAKKRKEGWLFYWWGISILLYLTVFATGNVRHDYYQVLTIPIISIFVARGISSLIQFAQYSRNTVITGLFLIIAIIFMEMFGWYHIRDFYNINHPEIVEAGRAVENKTNDRSLVIAPYNGDTAFLYQTKRRGWPVVELPINELIDEGAQYYVSVNYDEQTKKFI